MSRLSGKSDLYDTVCFCDPTPEEGKGYRNYDLYRGFEVFKQKTGGMIHQKIRIQVDDYDIQREIERGTKTLVRWVETVERDDKRTKSGKRIIEIPHYKYYGKECSLSEINRIGYYATRDIKFDDLLELLPFLPYIVGVMASDPDGMYIEIGQESYSEQHAKESVRYENSSFLDQYYRKELADLYREVCKHYEQN